MSEKQKMIDGKIYNPNDKMLVMDRIKAKNLCYAYNNLKPELEEEKKNIIKSLLGKTGENFQIEPSFFCDYGYNVEIGENFYSNHNLVILDCTKVIFGKNTFIGPNCGFYTAEHPLDYQTRNKGQEFAKPITIGDNVWIGGNVVVIGGVTIGNNVVIGAGSIVTKDIPDNSIAVGNPCKVIRKV
ncbi:sugar O-acetyltransferase [bacterium]|nr:sugar O-acetyltransferase [bacterium]